VSGKVWLVGAGPGDPGLFTLKGKTVLEQADVVVYDALVGRGVMNMIPTGTRLINVGKRSGNHTMRQEDINRVLLEEALKGNQVVRLKGGDPFLFGRGGEELELLTENNIPYEIVSGVTSAIAVPAYNGIPVTHRDFCSSVHIITGHKRKDAELDINFKALVEVQGTLVFLMGLTAMESICNGLMKAGMSGKTPAAVLQQGTTANQRRCVATLATLKSESEKAGIHSPAIIVVGKVCQLSGKFGWYEQLPLAGTRILITRPGDLSSGMASMLRVKGAEVLELPAIRLKTIEPNPALDSAISLLADSPAYNWIVFTSPSGVRFFMDRLLECCDVRSLAGSKLAALGTGTARELKKYGLKADLIPEIFDGKNLGKSLAPFCHAGDRILIPRASIGNHELIDELEKVEGLIIEDIATYDTTYACSDVIDEKAEFESGNIDYAVFTSASTVKGFAEAVKGLDFSLVKAVCIGRQTKAAADKLGMKTFMSEKATMASVCEKLEQLVLGSNE